VKVIQTLPQADLNAVPAAAKAADDAGFDVLMSMENQHEPFLALAIAAVNTKRAELGPGIAIAFARSPMAVANVGWDLQRASNGRFVLGLGPQIRPHNEKRFSVPWSPPMPRLREYVHALRAIWRCWETGEKLRFEGKHYTFTLMTPNFTPESTGQPPIPITISAVGPHSLRLAGEACDGVRLHPFCTRAYLEEVALPLISEGMAKTGRTRETFEVTGGGFVATGATDAEVHEVAEWTRYRIGFYGSTPGYWPVFEHHGLGDLGRKLNAMTKAGEWDKIAAEIDDDTLHLFTAIGRYDEIASVIEKRFGGLSDTVNPGTSVVARAPVPSDVLQDIKRIPMQFSGFAPKQ
jgi:probable F420-dependent oxidoreductase